MKLLFNRDELGGAYIIKGLIFRPLGRELVKIKVTSTSQLHEVKAKQGEPFQGFLLLLRGYLYRAERQGARRV